MAVDDHGLEVLKKAGEEIIVGDKSNYVFKTYDDGRLNTITETISSALEFMGRTRGDVGDTSVAQWQISRKTVQGQITTFEYADNGNFSQIWDDRVSIFGGIPFLNNFSIQFDGSNDFIDIPNNASMDFDFRSEPASWNFWIKTPTTNNVTYFEKQDSNTGWRIYTSGQDITLELRGTGVGDSIRVRTEPANSVRDDIHDGLWHMVTVTYDGSGNASGVTIYVDAQSEALDVQNDMLTGDTRNTGNSAIGSRSGGGDHFGPGNIDEVSIWDVELSSDNVTTIYNSGFAADLQGQGVSPITTSLVYWVRMGDGTNDSFPNIVDVENNIIGTMTNMTAGDIEGAVPSDSV